MQIKFYIASWLLKIYLHIVSITSKVVITADKNSKALMEDPDKAVLLAMWHGKIFMMPKIKFTTNKTKQRNFVAVTSTHRDGQYVESFLQRFNIDSIRGSSNNGGFKAMAHILSAIKKNKIIAITPDGPKGPRHGINGNIHNVAHKFALPIIPVCYSSSRKKVFNTWDKFLLPLPFSAIKIDIGKVIDVSNLQNEDERKKFLAQKMISHEINVE